MFPYLKMITDLLGSQEKNAQAAQENQANAYMGKPMGAAPASSMSGISDLLGKMPGKGGQGEASAPHGAMGSDGLMDPWAGGGHSEPDADNAGGAPDEDEDDLMSV